MRSIRVGAGSAYAGDRIEPAVELAESGRLDYLVFECLAERTTALAQQAKAKDPSKGYDPILEPRTAAAQPATLRPQQGQIIDFDMGAAIPITGELNRPGRQRFISAKIAAITGDDVLAELGADYPTMDTGEPIRAYDNRLVSANAYLGAEPIVAALAGGANIVIAGRIADPALFLAPLVHEFGWSMADWAMLGRGVAVGHLLECGAQVTGGYFADPGVKDVPNLARIGFPLAEVRADGLAWITKVEGSGGMVTEATVKEQLLYEVHDPAAYFQPDVVADFSRITVTQDGPDRVRIEGATGHPRSETLKVTVGYLDGFIGEGEISYAGPGAVARARLAQAVVAERFKLIGTEFDEIRFDLIGIDALHGAVAPAPKSEPNEVRLRVAARARTMADALIVGQEVETLWVNGPAGGGGARRSAREVLAVHSILLPRHLVRHDIRFLEA